MTRRWRYAYTVGTVGTVEADTEAEATEAAREAGEQQVRDGSIASEVEVREMSK